MSTVVESRWTVTGPALTRDLDNPLGRGGLMLHEWGSKTRTFQELFGSGGGATGVDDDFEARAIENVRAWILGRNMFGPIAVIGRMTDGEAGGGTIPLITRTSSS